MGFANVAVERFQVELQLAEMLGLKLFDLQFEIDKAIEGAVEEQEVQFEISAADLKPILAANEAEIATDFDQELLEILDQSVM